MRRSTEGDSNVRDLLVEAVGAAYQGSTTLKEQQYKKRQQRQGLAGRGCRSSISGEYYAEGLRSSGTRGDSNVRDLLGKAIGAAY